MNNLEKQTITMAAVCQASVLVQKIARTGTVEEAELAIMLNSIMVTSPESILEVYSNDVAHLTSGLKALIEQLGNQTSKKDPELTRYVVSLLGLERRLANKKNQLSLLGERIEQSQRQLAHYEITSDTLIASLASIYSDLLSPIGTPIQVAGEPSLLKQQSNQHKIRALLLAGVRSSVLWRQVGGKRRNILFGRTKLVACAQQLLKEL
ncbi:MULTISPECIES: high frequency lysogenization protein HflD [unclassified Colwellia]|uniref:high frequency lysogenization protein HflD n=1 Tax=unclassified Colwellia TaxID=196834 RepID=UPI0015F4CA51|nr:MULTISPECIES: high frequency lysogenization protein HflD [unclassified Colwellia]MBA6225267.1 high frequency lysogenization protein HflD [Colwellia sp. MB3u-45]MBA6266264.1 high frequency lysogenization protein HflD [Colwellia sp. MB3u-43]MBA6289900.1 high frequency lysogenization protein HflD [Colwellia sp. MB3u-4]MBA6297215.1 high frequency lysogenization protein HflD [Colwellia sp. MB02u-9]MBA6322895.1 high frequency lysogenization protein HflD [Colwellia sp. MB02u-19]